MRVRFCPSPTGTPHVGLIRTALFNWAYARHTGGDFVFRLEDTDAERDSEESYLALLDALNWLGLNYDEGPEVGGPYGPYRQSERRDIYRDVVARLVAAGEVYEAYSTPEEVEARHRGRGPEPEARLRQFRSRPHRRTARRPPRRRAAGRCCGCGCPTMTITWNDLVRGETTFAPGTVPDYALTRGSGDPLYTLVNPVDDALMKITHVLRGDDLLSSTPRQIALYQALMRIGVAERIPEFGHLPAVLGEGNKKLSKRDPAVESLPAPRPRLHPRGSAELPGAAGLVDRRRPRRVQPRRDGRGLRCHRRQLQSRPASTRRRPMRSTPTTFGC